MLKEATTKKMSDFHKQKDAEVQFVSKLKKDLHNEKTNAVEKRRREMREAQQVISENQRLREKLDEEVAKERE